MYLGTRIEILEEKIYHTQRSATYLHYDKVRILIYIRFWTKTIGIKFLLPPGYSLLFCINYGK